MAHTSRPERGGIAPSLRGGRSDPRGPAHARSEAIDGGAFRADFRLGASACPRCVAGWTILGASSRRSPPRSSQSLCAPLGLAAPFVTLVRLAPLRKIGEFESSCRHLDCSRRHRTATRRWRALVRSTARSSRRIGVRRGLRTTLGVPLDTRSVMARRMDAGRGALAACGSREGAVHRRGARPRGRESSAGGWTSPPRHCSPPSANLAMGPHGPADLRAHRTRLHRGDYLQPMSLQVGISPSWPGDHGDDRVVLAQANLDMDR